MDDSFHSGHLLFAINTLVGREFKILRDLKILFEDAQLLGKQLVQCSINVSIEKPESLHFT